jgi:AraC family transcriptional regulator
MIELSKHLHAAAPSGDIGMHTVSSSDLQPEIIARAEFFTVGIRITTHPMSGEIPALWQSFGPRIDEVKRIAEPRVSYGIMQNHDAVAGTLDYMAAVSVPSPAEAPEGMTTEKVPANTYAVFNATLASIGEVFGFIFNEWLPGFGFEQLKAPYFERYGVDFDPSIPDSRIQIFIPVKRRV